VAFLFGAPEADAPTRPQNSCFADREIEKLIPNQSVLALMAHTWALQNCMSLIQKTKEVLESGFRILSNLFILNNMAERVGFEFSL
jgi:hypothetical protein